MSLGNLEVVRVSANMSLFGIDVVNVYALRSLESTAIEDEDVAEDMDEWLSGLYTTVQGLMVNDLAPVDLSLYNLSTEITMGSWPWTSWSGGTQTQNTMATGAALLIKAASVAASVKGKKFLPGIAQNLLLDGVFTSAILPSVANFITYWLSGFESSLGNSYVPVIWSSKNSAGYTLLEGVGSLIPAYQRRRRLGTGS